MNDQTIRKLVRNNFWNKLVLSHIELTKSAYLRAFELAYPLIRQDLDAYVRKDPAAKGSYELVVKAYSCFTAVALYRIARVFYLSDKTDNLILSRAISEHAKVLSNVEIHPGADIGERFVIDHGTGTVIGETCEIGDDCYILNGVVLGSRHIANNPTEKRHPTIGSNVEVGANVAIYGPIKVGDDCKIGPNSRITSDLAKGSVFQCSRIQMYYPHGESNLEVHDVFFDSDHDLTLLGKNLSQVNLSYSTKKGDKGDLQVTESDKNKLTASIDPKHRLMKRIFLSLYKGGKLACIIMISQNLLNI